MAPPPLECRLAASADLDAVLAMMSDFNAGEGIDFNLDQFRPSAAKLIDDSSLGLLPLFLIESDIAGYAVLTWGYDLEFGGRDAFLTELFIQPRLRGRGLGKAALSHVENLARSHGAAALHLGVRAESAPAVKLYRGSGYADWRRRFMTKKLQRQAEVSYRAAMEAIIKGAIPVMPSIDVAESLRWWIEQCGFEETFRDATPPNYAGIKRGDAYLHIAGMTDKKLARTVGNQTMVRLAVKNIEDLYAEFQKRGGKVHPNGPLQTKPWGTKEFGAIDPCGVCVTFQELWPSLVPGV